MYQETSRYIAVSGPDLNKSFKDHYGLKGEIFFRDGFLGKKGDKVEFLREDVQKLSSLFAEHGLPFPKDPYSKVRVLSGFSYLVASSIYGTKNSVGFSLPKKNLGFVDGISSEYIEMKSNLPWGVYLRATFLHELLHCMEYKERWILIDDFNKDKKQISMAKREGLYTSSPNPDHTSSEAYRKKGALRIGEGLAEYLSLQIIDCPDLEQIEEVAYEKEVKIIKYLVNKIGIGPLLRAAYSKNGLEELSEKMAELFGEKSLSRMLKSIGKEYFQNIIKGQREWEEGVNESDYLETRRYLRSAATKRELDNKRWSEIMKITEESHT